MLRFGFILLVVSFVLIAQSAFAQVAAPPIPPPDYTQGTQSVMVSRFEDDAPAVANQGAASQPIVKQTAAAKPARMNDKNVQPASVNQPLDTSTGNTAANVAADVNRPAGDGPDAASVANSMAAADLLSHALEAPKSDPLPGTPIMLLQAIGPLGSNRAAQLAVAHAYWKLSAAQADYNWAIEEADELDKIAAGTTAVERSEMATAHASTQARVLEAKLAAVTAQTELAGLLGISPTGPLPLAADPPLVGAYRTFFEAIYAGRLPPPRMRLIDRTLPLRREAIETHVATVQAAASAVHAADEAHAKSQTDLYNLLYCEAELSRQRRSFLVAVRDYNLDIAEYALSVAEPNVPVERVIGMLIRVKQPTAAPASAPTAAQATAPTTISPPAAGATARPSPDNPLMQPALPKSSAAANAGPATTGAASSSGSQWSGAGTATSPANPSPGASSPPPANSTGSGSAGSPGAPIFTTSPSVQPPSFGTSPPPASQPAPSSGGAVVNPTQNAPEFAAPK